MVRWGWGTEGKMVGVGYQTGDGMGFHTHGGVPDRARVLVMWWDTRHRWDTRQDGGVPDRDDVGTG